MADCTRCHGTGIGGLRQHPVTFELDATECTECGGHGDVALYEQQQREELER